MTVKPSNDPNLFKPLELTGAAVERDRAVKDKNDAAKPDEAQWLANAEDQDAAISAAEVEFFSVLRERMG